jgi:hypothetical protein
VDLQTLTPLALPVQNLERYVYEKIALGGRALAASADLAGSIDALEESIQVRNTVIVEIHKERDTIPDELLAERYFGLRSAHGLTDERFKASIETIYRQTDDCIFFSRILAEDLATRGDRLRRKNAWRYWFGLPKVMKADWSKVEQMLPADKDYALWLAGFKTQPTIWQRIRARIFVSSGI